MAARQEDFFTGDDLDAIFAVIDHDILGNTQEMNVENPLVDADTPGTDSSTTFPCAICSKVCLTERGSTRHTNAKHNNLSHDKIVPSTSKVKTKSAEKILHPLYLKQFVEKGITKLINDGFYPEEIVNELNQYTVGNLDKINHTYSFIKRAISSFNGDVVFTRYFTNVFLKQIISLKDSVKILVYSLDSKLPIMY